MTNSIGTAGIGAGSVTSNATRTGRLPNRPIAPRLSVGFILAHRFTLCAFANFVDVLRLAADEGDRSRPILCEWAVLSDQMRPVASSCGMLVQPTERLGDPTKFDYIVVIGGLIDEISNLSPDYIRYLRQAAAAKIPLVGVCTGAFILQRAGLMDGYRCCISWFHHADFLEQFDGITPVSDQIFIVDRDRLTCSGGTSSAHLAAYLVEKHVGRAQARKSLHIMIIDDALRGEKPQPGIPLDFSTNDEVVRKALLLMQQNIDVPLSVAEMARRLGAARRQMERHFQNALGMTPTEAYRIMRLEHAEFLLRNTEQSVTEVAAAVGFCDSSHFVRAFKERRGMTPSVFRKG
ncbi:AraC family transcriptional regulator [Azospirillum sp. TSH100]|uniref:GlxA family transcriptional regulator n=1 Tax=Azospirillum sp. TSH100 TaxID=652764 RepID=UPI000D617B46|nr:GlxA family transcriptional regulator [Azospirillum sp. TSH100]PWC87467.1 AraC family transcriptional regulator [Azospirillum sp. TSH100]QCG89734.1 GlxA family transcriptional regulator [Azospirillum sp. TSH100]